MDGALFNSVFNRCVEKGNFIDSEVIEPGEVTSRGSRTRSVGESVVGLLRKKPSFDSCDVRKNVMNKSVHQGNPAADFIPRSSLYSVQEDIIESCEKRGGIGNDVGLVGEMSKHLDLDGLIDIGKAEHFVKQEVMEGPDIAEKGETYEYIMRDGKEGQSVNGNHASDSLCLLSQSEERKQLFLDVRSLCHVQQRVDPQTSAAAYESVRTDYVCVSQDPSSLTHTDSNVASSSAGWERDGQGNDSLSSQNSIPFDLNINMMVNETSATTSEGHKHFKEGPSPLPAYKLPGSSSGIGSGRSKRKSSIPCKSVAASSSSALEEGESVLDEMDCSVLKSVARPDTYQPDLGHIGFLQSGSPQEVHDVISQESNFQDKNFYPYSTLGRPLAPEVQLSREKVKHFSDNPNNFNFLDQNFQYRKDIKKHVLIRAGIKPYQCDFCGEKFNRSDYLREHTLLHTGEKPYKCDLCGAKFIRSSHLKRHKLIHTGEKPHICGLCDARFNQESSLKRHILIHTGEKPYKCDVCEARFNQASSLKQHTLLHTGEKPYKCDVCDERFKSRRNLKQHLKITHIDPLEFQKRKSLQL